MALAEAYKAGMEAERNKKCNTVKVKFECPEEASF